MEQVCGEGVGKVKMQKSSGISFGNGRDSFFLKRQERRKEE